MTDIPCIQVDLLCIECEYNLRGLSSDGKCPECGRPIVDSLSTNTMPLGVPGELRIVAVLFILAGMGSLANIAFELTQQKIHLDLSAVCLFTGVGLLRYSWGWRTWALFNLWLAMIALPIVLVVAGVSIVRLGGQPVGSDEPLVAVLVGCALYLVCVWQYGVLTRPRLRALFVRAERCQIQLEEAYGVSHARQCRRNSLCDGTFARRAPLEPLL